MTPLWEKLRAVKQFSRHTQKCGRAGEGRVLVSCPAETVLIFHERGSWGTIEFSNTLRWTLDLNGGKISLEHLRLGVKHPKFLLDLFPTNNNIFESVVPHQCKKDVYLATLLYDNTGIRLNWNISGPKKNEKIELHYT